MSSNESTLLKLAQELEPEKVKTRKGTGNKQLSYIEGWQAENTANSIFDFKWNKEIISQDELFKRDYKKESTWDGKTTVKDMFEVAYKCKVRVHYSIGDYTGFRDGIGFGNGQAGKTNVSSAYELAIKESVTDGLKIALKSLGKQFGLSLYDKDIDILESYHEGKTMSLELTESIEKVHDCKTAEEVRELYKNYDGAYRKEFDKACANKKKELKNEGA